LILCGVLALAPAASADNMDTAKDAGIGVGSAFASLIYAPVKLGYAVGGLIVGGLAWAFSGGDNNVAKVVLTPSVLGDYVVTPQHLTGEKTIEFFGRDPEYRDDAPVDVAAAGPAPEPDYDQAW
jgi:hypothetical protein